MTIPSDALTLAQHREAISAALVDCSQRLLGATKWAVACLHNHHGLIPAIAALNTYNSLPDALEAYGDLRAAADPHEVITLVPVGPVTEGELREAGLIT